MSETEKDWKEEAVKQKDGINLMEVIKDKLTDYI